MVFKFKNSLLILKNTVLKIGYYFIIYLVEIEEKKKVDFKFHKFVIKKRKKEEKKKKKRE